MQEREREKEPSSVENALSTKVKVEGNLNGWSVAIANKSCMFMKALIYNIKSRLIIK